MESDHFGSFTTSAVHHLFQINYEFYQKYSDTYFARYTFDPDDTSLTFFDRYDSKLLVLDYIEIGTYSNQSRTWRWGWSTPGVPDHMQRRSQPMRELRQATGDPLFSNPEPFLVWEDMPIKLSALVMVRHGNNRELFLGNRRRRECRRRETGYVVSGKESRRCPIVRSR